MVLNLASKLSVGIAATDKLLVLLILSAQSCYLLVLPDQVDRMEYR